MKRFKLFLVLHIILLLYSFGGFFSKLASEKPFLSFDFCLFYGLVLLVMAVYAVLWQQILKYIPLNMAYANKAVTLVWGMVWGAVFFKEHISLSNIIGAVIVLAGVLLMVTGGEKNRE